MECLHSICDVIVYDNKPLFIKPRRKSDTGGEERSREMLQNTLYP